MPRFAGPVGTFRLTITSEEGAFPLLKRAPNVIRTSIGRDPLPYALTVSNPGLGTLRYQWRSDQPWVHVENAVVDLKGTDAPEQHSLRFDMNGLKAGRPAFTLTFKSDAGSQDYAMELHITKAAALCLQSAGVEQADPGSIQISSADLAKSSDAQLTISNCGAQPVAYSLQPLTTTARFSSQSDFSEAMRGDWLQPGEARQFNVSAAKSLDASQPAEVWAIVDSNTKQVIGHIEIGTEPNAPSSAW